MKQREIASVYTDQPTDIGTVRLPKWGWIGKKFGIHRKVSLAIKGQPTGKVELIAAELDDMLGAKDIKELNQADQINTLLRNNVTPLVKIIALAVSPEDKMPSPDLIKAIKFQFTTPMLANAFNEVYRRLDLTTFFDIMTLAKNLSLSLIPETELRGQD